MSMIEVDCQKVQEGIEAIKSGLGAHFVEIFTCNGRWEIVWGGADRDSTESFVTADSLEGAYTAAMQEVASPEPVQ